MSVALVLTEPLFVECSRIDVCGDHCDECDGMGEVAVDVSWFATLVHNLAMGGALCRSYELGDNPPDLGPGERKNMGSFVVWIPDGVWQPGCGKAVP